MAISVRCTGVRRVNGRVYIRWNDKTELEFESVADAREYVRQFDSTEIRDFLRAIALAKFLKSDPTAANAALLNGKTVTLDLDAAANLVRIA